MTSEPTQPTHGLEPGAAEPVAAEPVAPQPAPFGVPPQPVAPAKPKPRGGPSWINVALGLALAIAIGGVAFAAGRMTAPVAAAGAGRFGNGADGNGGRTFNGYFPGGFQGNGEGGQGGPGRFFGGGGGASIEGTVTAVTPDSITIKTAGGQTVTIALDTTTTYHQQQSATSSDVKTGGDVIVRLNLRGAQPGSSGQTGPSASDITIVP